jgi:hypothetical protein
MLSGVHLELRLAFKACARAHRFTHPARQSFTTCTRWRSKSRGHDRTVELPVTPDVVGNVPRISPTGAQTAPPHGSQSSNGSKSTKLVPQRPKHGSLQSPRRSDVPARLLPKAQVTPDLTLSPKERLQIEHATRQPPKISEKKGM